MKAKPEDDLGVWQAHLTEMAAEIAERSADGDWATAGPLLTRYTDTLRAPPPVAKEHLQSAYEAAQMTIRVLTTRARQDHNEAKQQVRDLRRGRQAVSAYK